MVIFFIFRPDMTVKRRKRYKNKTSELEISMSYNEQKSKFWLITNPSNNKFQISNKSQWPKFEISNLSMILKKWRWDWKNQNDPNTMSILVNEYWWVRKKSEFRFLFIVTHWNYKPWSFNFVLFAPFCGHIKVKGERLKAFEICLSRTPWATLKLPNVWRLGRIIFISTKLKS